MPMIKIHFRGDFFLAVIGGVTPFGAVLPKAIDGVGADAGVVGVDPPVNALGAVGVPKLFA